jgi:alpha-L-arabinofuranosidase
MVLQRDRSRAAEVLAQERSRRSQRRRRTIPLRLERLEDRIVPTTDTWISSTSGSWSTVGNWSTGAVPGMNDDVVINTSPSVTVTLTGSTSVKSLTLTGDTLRVTGGTLSVAANSSLTNTSAALILTNANLAVAGGATLTNLGSISSATGNGTSALLIGGTLNNTGVIRAYGGTLAVDATGSITQLSNNTLTAGTWEAMGPATLTIAPNLLANPDFESPTITTNGTTAPGSWTPWGSSYLSKQFAYTGTQSLQESGPNSGVEQTFAVTPGVSYTLSGYVMTPSSDKLGGTEEAYIQLNYYDANGKLLSPSAAPYDVAVLTSTSKAGGPLGGTVGSTGWNYYTTTAVAPAGAATVTVELGTGAYNGTGSGSGSAYWDQARFGPTAAFATNKATLVLAGAGSTITGLSSLTTNSGSILVEPGAKLGLSNTFTQTSAGSLTLTPGSLSTGVGTNLLTNPGFEAPTATNSTTLPSGWNTWGTPYLSTQFAQTGTQSLQTSGPNTGVSQSFAVMPGVSYTGSVDAMTPASDPLTGPEGAFLQVLFFDANGNLISSYSPPNSVTILTSQSKPGGPIKGSVSNQGWNLFSTTAVAPANAATANFILETGAYTGLPGTAGGEIFWDNAAFGPTAVSGASLITGQLTNSGTITVGVGDNVQVRGTLTQTSTGTLAFQLGGPPGSGLYGSLTGNEWATLAGTLKATLANGYPPAVNDGFNLLSYAGITGNFGSVQLPSGTGYSFQAAVNPTYTAIGALPTPLSATVNAGSTVAPVSTTQLGVNLAWWDDKLTTSQTQQMVQAAGLTAFRFPGGSSSDDFHFNVAANYNDPAAITIPQFAQFIQAVGGTGLLTLDYGSGSPQEAAAELAYLEGSPSDTTVIGTGLEWNDSTNAWQSVDWKTVGYWASLRAATPLGTDDGYNFLRIGQTAPFSTITYWEVGNEEYGSWEIDHHGTAGPGGVSTGAPHDPATYASFAQTFANYAAEIDPHILIGIDSGDPTGNSDNNWTSNVLKAGVNVGFVPGFISDHSYMQGPGQESDRFLLQNTVTNTSSVLDWATRYGDYESMLQTDLGNQASSVRVMATEFNSVYTNPGKQSTSLVNGLFIADSIGSLLGSGYTGGFVWDLRNGWGTGNNNSPSLYGWRQGGDYGLLGDPGNNSPPSTGPYVPYPNYFAEQLASKIVQAGGTVVSASSNFSGLDVFAVKEANGHLDLLVINKDPSAQINEPFTIQGFTPSGQAHVWQYSEVQDYAQSKSTTGASALSSANVTLTLSGSNFSYSFPAYSMTVIDLTPSAPTIPVVRQAASVLSPPLTPTLSPAPRSDMSGQVQQLSQDTVSIEQGAMSGNVAVLLQLIEDFEMLVMKLEQEVWQLGLNDLIEL